MARISQMFDPLNYITTHAIIAPKAVGEREMAAQHFEHIGERDLILLDRGYPAFWIFQLILSKKAHFCARISLTKWKAVQQFINSGKTEDIISINAPVTSRQACKDRQLSTDSIPLRFLRVELDTGEIEVLVTSLLDSQRFPSHIFRELYHDRWAVEEDYKVIKCRMELENFSGKSPLSVYQDFHASVFSKNVTSMLVGIAQERVVQSTEQRACHYKVNFTQALSTMRDTIILLFHKSYAEILEIISDLLDTFVLALEPIRPDRKYPRKHKRAQRRCCLNYKPTL